MSSAVESRAAATPPAGLPPDSQIGTADPYSPRDPYGRSLLDPGSCDVSDWLGVRPAANGANDASGASGSGDAAPIPSGLSEARDLAMAYRSAIWLIDTRKQPLRQLVARVMREVHDAPARGVTVDGLRAAKRMIDAAMDADATTTSLSAAASQAAPALHAATATARRALGQATTWPDDRNSRGRRQ
eukprot:g589.t1